MQEQRRASIGWEWDTNRELSLQRLLATAKRVARHYSIQAALYYTIYLLSSRGKPLDPAKAKKLYEAITGRKVHQATITKQLRMLERKGLIRIESNKIIALKKFSDTLDLFDSRRSRAGRKGAQRRLVYSTQVRHIPPPRRVIPRGAEYYLQRVLSEAKKLIGRRDRTAALDLLVHTLLPVRENGVLWLWYRDKFIYYEPKTDRFHIVSSKPVAKLLRKLGYTEGIMAWHILGHERASRIIKQIFIRGPYSWTWARSLAYVMKELGYIRESEPVVIYINYSNGVISVSLRDFYTDTITLYEASTRWEYGQLPAPLTESNKSIKRNIVGVVHVDAENDEPYFSKFS